MAETVNQEQTTTAPEKTFTQDELNAILNDRLARERKKYEGVDLDELKRKAAQFDELEEAGKTELEKEKERAKKLQDELDAMKQAKKIQEIKEKVAKETGVPTELLTETDEERCMEQAERIKAYASPSGYPAIRDGGDPGNLGKRGARDDFAAFAQQLI